MSCGTVENEARDWNISGYVPALVVSSCNCIDRRTRPSQRPAPVHPSVIHRQGRAWWAGNNLLRPSLHAAHCGAHYRVRGLVYVSQKVAASAMPVWSRKPSDRDNHGDTGYVVPRDEFWRRRFIIYMCSSGSSKCGIPDVSFVRCERARLILPRSFFKEFKRFGKFKLNFTTLCKKYYYNFLKKPRDAISLNSIFIWQKIRG